MSTIAIASPIRPSARSGNDATTARWADRIRSLGHTVVVIQVDEDATGFDRSTAERFAAADVLIALHARRSAPAVRWWSEHRPDAPLIVGLAGTDLYRDLPDSDETRASVERADALIVLQAEAVNRLEHLDPAWADKAAIVYQSTGSTMPARRPTPDEFRVVVLAHLRPVKDPLLAARAARHLPAESRVVVHHAGRALEDEWEAAATAEMAENPRYRWHRELEVAAALELLATAHVLACTSLSEGGANVVTEAMAVGVPVIGTDIGGNTGILGADHPGLFPVGDAMAMARLLRRLETEPEALAELQARTDALASITRPETERQALEELLDRVTGTPGQPAP